MAKGDTHLWLVFLGTVTIPVRATTATDARDQVLVGYADRGIVLKRREVNVRLARKSDAGWLRDIDQAALADELERASVSASIEAAARAYVRARHAFDETPAGPERAEARRRLDDRWDTLNDACGYTPAGSEPETERLFP